MNYDLNKYKFSVLDKIYKGIQEIPIDADLTLPDYCPDIGKILKCQISVCVLSRNISGDLLTFEGISILELFYSDLDKNTVKCFKSEIPFSQKINIKNSCEFAISTFETKREYVNCRAISPRRVDIHGAVSLDVQVFGSKDVEITNDISSEEIQQKKSDISFNQLSSIIQHQININEILEIGDEKSTPEFILKSDISISDFACETSDEKLNLKCKANIKIIYVNDIETGKLDSVEYEIPVNDIVDAPGVMDDNSFVIIPEIVSHDEKISSDESENLSNLINENIKLMVSIIAFQNDETKVINDAYSTQYETELCYDLVNFKKNFKSFDEEITHKETLNVSENKIFKILDVWHNSLSSNISENNSNLDIKGKVNVCILALNPEFVPFYFEREIEFSKNLLNDLEIKNIESHVSTFIPKIEYKILNNDSLELKLNVQTKIDIYQNNKIQIVNSITSNENSEKSKDSNTALTIYYASSGESIWDIAKQYGTTVDKIQDENEIDFEILDSDRAILIPIV